MKKLLVIAVMSSAFYSYSQNGYAKPKKVNGVTVYVMSEPVDNYEVVGQINTLGAQLLTAAFSESSADAMSIADLTNNLTRKALRKQKKGKVQPFDAIITDNGNEGTLIKFD